MRRISSYLRIYRGLLSQLIMVFLAFIIMVAMSSYFASSIVNKHISNYGDEVLASAAETIKAYFQGHEITLNDMAFVIEEAWAQGKDVDAIRNELIQWTNWLYANDDKYNNVTFLYGYVGNTFISGADWDYPEDYDPEARVWYIGANEQNGATFYSDPYEDAHTGEYVMTVSRQVFDSDGAPFGVIAMDIFISDIEGYIDHLQLMSSGFAVLMDSDRRFIVHPVPEVLGTQIEYVTGGSGYVEIADMLKDGKDISAFNYHSILGEHDVAFCKQLFNGWYLGLSLSDKVYYKDLNEMRVSLTVTGCFLALLVCIVLIFMYIAKMRSDEANKTKSSFLAKMSHEIRTPMNAVIGMAELLMHEPLSNRQAGYVNDINSAARSLLSIINDILDLSKIEAGKLMLDPVDYNFHGLLDNINSMFKYVAKKKGLEFRFEKAEETPKILFGDEIRLRQVLTNLCGNAVKYTEEGSVKLKISVSDNMLVLEVKDTGIGIPKKDMPNLFNAFEQVKTAKSNGVVGTGLGLTISKSFVEMMGGKIIMESEYGKGTIVTVTIPLVPGNESRVRDMDIKVKKLTVHAPDAKVLVVDDNDYNLEVARGLLMLFGIEADTAVSGRKAIGLVEAKEYDLVFMDHMMPEMDGIEATGEIRKLGGESKALPIIALTANAVQGAKDMFLKNGFNDYISKPIDMYDLSEILTEWLPESKVTHKTGVTEEVPAKNDFRTLIGKIEEIDINLGLSRVSGLEKVYINNLKPFCDSLSHENTCLSTSLKEGDLARFSISAHAMKSAFATVGAMDLSEEARKLEGASKEKNADYCTEYAPDFIAAAGKLISDLEKVLDKIDAQNPKMKKDIPDEETLRKLLNACNNCDIDEADKIVEELEQYEYTLDSDLVVWLRRNVDVTAFKKIKEKLLYLE